MANRSEALRNATTDFNKIDLDNSGELERHEIASLALQSGSSFGNLDEEVNNFLSNFDSDGDGNVSFKEWLDYFGELFDTVIAPSLI